MQKLLNNLPAGIELVKNQQQLDAIIRSGRGYLVNKGASASDNVIHAVGHLCESFSQNKNYVNGEYIKLYSLDKKLLEQTLQKWNIPVRDCKSC